MGSSGQATKHQVSAGQVTKDCSASGPGSGVEVRGGLRDPEAHRRAVKAPAGSHEGESGTQADAKARARRGTQGGREAEA